MEIQKLHDELKTALSLEKPSKHPKPDSNEIVAKNAFAPFNMLAISKTKLEKVGHHEELGDIYAFSHKKDSGASMFLYSSKLNAYGRGGTNADRERVKGLIETGNISAVVEALKGGIQHDDETDLYLSKDITKIIKKVSAKYGKNDYVSFTFVESGIKIHSEKNSAQINMLYHAKVDASLIGHGFSQSGIKEMKAGVWRLKGDKVYDYEDNNTFLNASRPAELKDINLPADHITLDTKEVNGLMALVSQAVDKNSMKTELNYLVLDVVNGKGRFVGTDGRRLTLSDEIDIKGDDGQYFIHVAHLSDYPNSIKISKKVTQIEYDEYTYKQELEYEPRFPDYQRIIPQNMRNSITVDTQSIKKFKGDTVIAVKNGKAFIGEVSDDEWETPDYQDMKPLVTSNVSASDVYVVLDSKYLKDAIDSSTEVTIGINDRKSPILIEGDYGLSVIMPLVHKTEEEKREEELKKQNKAYEAEESKRKREEYEKQKEEEELARQKEEDGIAHEWLMTLSPMQRGKARKMLSKLIRSDGEIIERKDYIKKKVDEGRTFEEKTYTPYNSTRERTEWGAVTPDGSSWSTISATEAKFGQFLLNNKM